MENEKPKNLVFVGICPTVVDGKIIEPTQEEKDRFLENMKKGAPEDTEYVYSEMPPLMPFL